MSLTMKLREKMVDLNKYKNLSSETSSNSEFGFLEQEVASNDLKNNYNDEALSLYQQDTLKKEAMQYDQEIDKLSEGMTSIHSLFKQMNEIVMHQGEVVDRIDYNIDVAMKHVSRGKTNLVQAKEYQEHGCARWCIRLQITAIVFLAVLIFIKYGKR